MSTTYTDLTFTTFPDSKQEFTNMLDINATDAPKVKAFQEAMENGDIATAQAIFETIDNASQKFINAGLLNTLMNTCQALQRFYDDDIEPTIILKQNEWENIVDKMSYKGLFDVDTQYQQNNYITYTIGGVNYIYIATATPPIGTLPTNTNYWRQLTIRGSQGQSGVGLSFRYTWSSSTPYDVQDLVTYNNALWGCIVANTNQTPTEGSSYWSLLANMSQVTYPFQSNQPSNQSVGDLWFKII